MTQNEGEHYFLTLPTEVLLYIFTFLPASQLIKNRQVCVRWKHIIDELTRSDALWRRYSKRDFSEVYQTARYNARFGLLWFDVYKCLSLWPRLTTAREERDEFASASTIIDEIRDFKVLRNGIIGVHKRTAIVYYDIETLEQSKRGPISGEYITYTETDDTIIIMNYLLHLFIVRKVLDNPHLEHNTTFDNIKHYIVVNRNIYFVNLANQIYMCNLDDEFLTGHLINHSVDSVMALSYSNNRLNVLTYQRDIFSIDNNKMVHQCALGPDTNLLHKLNEYKFLEHMDWKVYFQWMFILNQPIPQGPLQDIVTIRPYGDIYLVGTNWGVLRIYYKPYRDGQFDLFNSEPLKQYNFMERYDCPVLSMCPILQIDVLEGVDRHTVLVAMPKKIAVLDFIYNFKVAVSAAMLPYADIQKAKVLKIDDCI